MVAGGEGWAQVDAADGGAWWRVTVHNGGGRVEDSIFFGNVPASIIRAGNVFTSNECTSCEHIGPRAGSGLVRNIVILGAGSIGISFAAVFYDSGDAVTIVEPDEARRNAVHAGVEAQLDAIRKAGLERGRSDMRPGMLPGIVNIAEQIDEVLDRAELVIECGPEKLDVKQKIFRQLIDGSKKDAVLATASSAIPVSWIVPDLADQARCLVAHPVNPPAILRLIELAPAPGTSAETMDRAVQCFEDAGFEAVALSREIEGFVLNRLQGAVLREAYRLVDEGIVDVAGVETVMRLGLGPRWALSGPFETAELNTPGGIKAHAARMGPAYRSMGESRGESGADWHDDLVDEVNNQRRKFIALEDLPARAAWRIDAVAKLISLRDKLFRDGNGK